MWVAGWGPPPSNPEPTPVTDDDVEQSQERYCPGTRLWIIEAASAWVLGGGGNSDDPDQAEAKEDAEEKDGEEAPSAGARLFGIVAGPGVGKTTVASVAIDRFPERIVGYFFCKHDSGERSDSKRMLRTLAFQLAARLPAFEQALLEGAPELNLNARSTSGAAAATGTVASFTSMYAATIRPIKPLPFWPTTHKALVHSGSVCTFGSK